MKRNLIWVCILGLMFCFLLTISVYSYWDTQTIAAGENRALTQLPFLSADTWFSGDYAKQAEDFYSDHALFRNWLVSRAQQLEVLIERRSDVKLVSHDVDIAVDINTVDPDIAQNSAASAAGDAETMDEITQAASETDPDGGDDQQDYLILDDRILSVFVYDESNIWYYINTVNMCFNAVSDYINKYLMLAPSRIEFEEPDIRQYSDAQKPVIDLVYKSTDSLVRTVDCYTPLSEQEINEIYYRTDHHWSQFGAYFAAKAFFEEAGVDYVPIEQYDKFTGKPFLGYLYAQNNIMAANLKTNPDKLEYYLYNGINNKETYYTNGENGTYVEGQDVMIDPARQGYYTFLQTSGTYLVLEGSRNDGSCILVVGDSYTDALVTWFAQSYERVILLDPREYVGGRTGFLEMIQTMGVTDFLMMNHVNDLEHVYFTSQIEKLINEAEVGR